MLDWVAEFKKCADEYQKENNELYEIMLAGLTKYYGHHICVHPIDVAARIVDIFREEQRKQQSS